MSGHPAVYIYALVDPRTDEVRYVGKAANPEQRLNEHCIEARNHSGRKSPRATWIFSLLAKGLAPTLTILESTTEDGWEEAERRWIAHYRSLGAQITNLTLGGKGARAPWPPDRLGFTDEIVMAIRHEYAAGDSTYYLARKYSTSHTNIRWMVTGRTWKHLPLVPNDGRVPVDRHARGDKNASRLYPERRPRGDGHWTRLKPDNLVTLRGEE